MDNATSSSMVRHSKDSVPAARGSEKSLLHTPKARTQDEDLEHRRVDADAADPYDNIACTD